MNIHYSAQFALCMLELMYAVRTQSHKGAFWLLLVSESKHASSSLLDALCLVCPGEVPPGHPGFTDVTFAVEAADVPATRELPQESFFNFAASECLNAAPRSTTLVFCTERTAGFLRSGLPADTVVMFNNIASLDRIKKDFIRNKDDTKAKILFMIGTDAVPVQFDNLSSIIVDGCADVEPWERSRILRQNGKMSMALVQTSVAYFHQGSRRSQMNISIPALVEFRGNEMPIRRLGSAQVWGFIADLALHFHDLSLTACFLDNGDTFKTVLLHFGAVGFVRPIPADGVREYWIPEAARDMTALLGYLGHDFHLAWLLSVGMKQYNVTTAAKRALVRIVALARVKFRVIDKAKLIANRQEGATDARIRRFFWPTMSSFISPCLIIYTFMALSGRASQWTMLLSAIRSILTPTTSSGPRFPTSESVSPDGMLPFAH
ncbi:hypothetical protein PWT90_02393 [Aphanocladium album]|nr:hypothetical protein PWT90_02393 [Aphanocladium album]